MQYCDRLFHIERKIKHLSPEECVQIHQKESKPILGEFLDWIDRSPLFGKNAIAKAAAQANAICLSLAETAKANGINFYKYLVKLLTDLPNLSFHQQPKILHNYMPWSENIQSTCAK